MTKSEQQVQALIAFEKSISRPSKHGPCRQARETNTHRRWRMLFSIVQRFRLYADALPIEFGMTRGFFNAEDAERAAHHKMQEEKRRREMDFLSGKRKSAPPWDF